MKTLLALTLLALWSINIIAQTQPKVKNNVHIDEATDIKITGSNVSIGKIIINEAVKSKILLARAIQSKDTVGRNKGKYRTIFTFVGQDHMPFYGVNMSLQFDKPVISCKMLLTGMADYSEKLSTDSASYQLSGSQLITDSFNIFIFSNTPIFTRIKGIDGVAH